MPEIFGFDAYSPKEISARVEDVGVIKARMPLLSMFSLSVLAGGFIGLGALYFTIVASDTSLSFAIARVLGGLVFSLGLILVVVGGAELFTGNNLIVMAWVSRKVTTSEVIKNWLIVYIGNFIGAAGLALLVYLSHHWEMANGAVGAAAVKIAAYKTSLPFLEAFFKGILCNILVCLAVWLCFAGRNVFDKIMAVIFPISAFVAAGFEHSIANMYFISLGMLLKGAIPSAEMPNIETLGIAGFANNLIPVTIGNIIGGSIMVALAYYIIYRRGSSA
ncbi:MAG: formate/nitrite transporter family protein [Nitrospirae bacterium]|nr:formate/nitrite transporter family protein [Nitrospirota bacterium]